MVNKLKMIRSCIRISHRQGLVSSPLNKPNEFHPGHCCFYSRPKLMSSNSSEPINTTNTMAPITQSHYEAHSAESYESAYFYEVGPYMKHLRDLCYNKLQLGSNWDNTTTDPNENTSVQVPSRILLDIGGGTGTFTRMLIEDTTNCEAIVIDPFLEQSSNGNTISNNSSNERRNIIQFIKAPAEAFMSPNNITTDSDVLLPQQYHQILMKEVAHHFTNHDRVPIFRGMYNGLIPTADSNNDNIIPSILVVTRPQIDIDYPLWDAAREVWKQNQPSVEQLMNQLRMAGFVNVVYTIESYPCSISIRRWQNMIQSRFWSTFANFTDEELHNACNMIATNEKNRITDDGIIHFEDRLLFITACKK
jgi:hypothetical protein